MANSNQITYQAVAEACQTLIKSGNQPSLRKIRDLTKGSFSSILAFYQRWKEEQQFIEQTDEEFSEAFRQAVLAEFGRVTVKLRERLMAQINMQNIQLEESQQALSEYEEKLEQAIEVNSKLQQESAQTRLEFEKELSAATALVAAANKREDDLRNQLESLRQALHNSELKTAVAEALYKKLQE